MTAVAADPLPRRAVVAFGSRRALLLSSATSIVYRHGWIVHPVGLLRAAVLPARDRLRPRRRSSGRCPARRRSRSRTSCSSRRRCSPSVGDERRDLRLDVQRLLQAELRRRRTTRCLATPLSAGDVALGEIGWALIRGGALRDRLPRRDARARARSCRRGRARPARRDARSGSPSRRSGMAATTFMRTWQDFDLIQLVDPAAVPVLGDVLSDRRRTRRPSRRSSSSRRSTTASTSCAALTLGTSARTSLVHVVYLAVMGIVGLVVVSGGSTGCC